MSMMRFTSHRTFWIALFSIFMMLMSSIVSSAPLMTFQMLSDGAIPTLEAVTGQDDREPNHRSTDHHHEAPCSAAMMATHHAESPSVPAHPAASSSNTASNAQHAMANCNDSQDMPHNCCSAACISVFAFLPRLKQSIVRQAQLVPFTPDVIAMVPAHPQSLYRPPIA